MAMNKINHIASYKFIQTIALETIGCYFRKIISSVATGKTKKKNVTASD